MINDDQNTTTSLDLAQIREDIDSVDQQIQQLINRRARLAEAVAKAKFAAEENPLFYRPEREAQVLRNVMQRNEGPLSDVTMARLFREIMSACLALEAPQSIAFLGPVGTYTHSAVLKHFGQDAIVHPLPTIDEVFREVEAGGAHYGLVPVENSSEGVVNHTLDCFKASHLNVIGEVELRIHHQFLVSSNTRKDSIKQIYAHQQTLAQCRKWLDAHYPGVERVALSSNAEAARRIRNEWHSAAIASEVAANLYELEILHSNIEDNPENTTRFLVIGREKVPPSGNDKTSLLISAHDRAGALLEILAPFAKHNISLTSIETRPALPEKWAYVFFIDLEGHIEQENVKAAIEEIRPLVKEIRVLGSYPIAVL
ncbi:prephenate dehydratase [Acinetobacter sp. C_4_1]|uniref:prephenate dehydratase n=1 Tax=unclassified Acinetobacter TaxID=196816 RepID=UPI0021B82203|nr:MULTISPECIES: prephenate dehydratase [unclassified Acinetobacter]MCT8089604.1 prephenate dehydratase [Acinetobacter sp. F_3_1]MCT8098323.1 prephenate dehydratase [Acinetobacter sp. C_3_1]MCT8101238.1 prephenate dehydratase [Acinetobacter sp. C_4_1]MCT8135226.1 prephenate dehydratase [Acinetobacter sp. T_3_1]